MTVYPQSEGRRWFRPFYGVSRTARARLPRIFFYASIICSQASWSPAQESPTAAEVQSFSGESLTAEVPMVQEQWADTVRRVTAEAKGPEREIGEYPGFEELKEQANERREALERQREIERRQMIETGRASEDQPPVTSDPSETETPTAPTTRLELQPAARAQCSVTDLLAAPASSPVLFDGPSEADTREFPPDSQIAAGPNFVVVAVNSLLAIYDKTGRLQGSFQPLNSFFSSLNITGHILDPRIIYDQTDQRFILSAGEIDFTGLTNGHVFLAVSATSDPNGIWNKFAIDFKGRNAANTAVTFPDFPGLGLSPSAVYIGTNQFEVKRTCLTADNCRFSDAWITVIALP